MSFDINDKADLANLAIGNKVMVGRSNVLYRTNVQNLPSRLSPRIDLVAPLLSDFSTWSNQSAAFVKQLVDGVRIWAPRTTPTGANPMMRLRTLPGGSWDVVLGAVRGFTFIDFLNGGLCLRESGTDKISVCGFGVPVTDNYHAQKYTSHTVFNANISTAQERYTCHGFFRARKVSTNIEYMYSWDGICWSSMAVHAISTTFTTAPDQWGFYLEANNSGLSVPAQMDIIHWDE